MNEQFEDLVSRHLAGQLTTEEKAALAQQLDGDPEARRQFVRLIAERTDLAECLAAARAEEDEPARPALRLASPRPARKQPVQVGTVIKLTEVRPWWPLALAACLVVGVGAAIWFGVSFNGTRLAQGVARVTAVSSPDGKPSWKAGDILPEGSVAIAAGKLELQFHSGTRLVLQGPCRMELGAEHSSRLLNGRVTASVPPFDTGYAIETAGMRIVDIGTEFGIECNGTNSELHVLQGTVIATAAGADLGQYLSERAAVRAGGALAKLEAIPFAPERFARPSVPAKLAAPGFIHYSFDEPSGLPVIDHGSQQPGGSFPANITNASGSTLRVPGRFGKAVALDGHGMKVVSTFPGIGGDHPRTVAMWVRLPPKATGIESEQSLASWGFPGRDGAHWLVGFVRRAKDGVLRTEFTGGRLEGSTPLGDGHWHHVASIYLGGNGGGTRRLLQYVDGRLEPSTQKEGTTIQTLIDDPESVPLTLGAHPYHRGSTTQALIDEFYLFDRVLTPGEIQSLYRNNRLTPAPITKK